MALNTLALRQLKTVGRYHDGNGLYLKIAKSAKSAGRSWQLRYQLDRKEHWLGLGPASIGLAEARSRADKARALLRQGIDPLAHKRAKQREAQAARTAETFQSVAALYIAAHESSWRHPKHRAQWHASLNTYVLPTLGPLPIAEIDTAAVMKVLEPLWHVKPETASRVRGRIETVLDYAKARGWREGENPARWRGHIGNLLPAKRKLRRREHYAAMSWSDLPGFMTEVAQQDSIAARALKFLVLTVGRSSEVRLARWREIDLGQAVWTIPASRMKAEREHRVPLSDAAIEILQAMTALRRSNESLIFPGARAGQPLSGTTLGAVRRRLGQGAVTSHGFRSSFRDWGGESTAFPREVIEMALAHRLGDAAEQAYARGDLFHKRRRLMAEWAAFCSRPMPAEGSNVTEIRAAVA
jgi:integrase